ncbi:MAG: hypothetical protein LBT63_02545 [Holosporaceae bacterium]|jgi:hypothetical protein|nr:hypothetical protein [Holosporaceae bacterium]
MRKILGIANFRKITVAIVFVGVFVGEALAAVFDLPNGTPGRQEIDDPIGEIHPDTAYKSINGHGAFCEHVIVPGTAHNITLFAIRKMC